MSRLFLAIGRASIIALLGGAIGGGLLLALEANGIDLKREVADAIRLAQSPNSLFAVKVTLSVLIGGTLVVAFLALRRFYNKHHRPPPEKVRALRAALLSTTEDVFDVVPNSTRATEAISTLRTMAAELESYKSIAPKLWELAQLADEYATVVMQRRDDEQTAYLHDSAIEQIKRLMRSTDWVVNYPG